MKRNLLPVLLIGGVLLLSAGLIAALTISGDSGETTTDDRLNEGQTLGGGDAPRHILTEFGDFQCPACAGYAPVVEELSQTYPDLKIVYKHFPLVQIHPNAIPSAKAAEAAGAQGKFWEYYRVLYERQTEWSELSDATAKFKEYAVLVGVPDAAKFAADMQDDVYAEVIQADLALAEELNLPGTPTFFLDGRELTTSSPAALRDEVARAFQ